MKAVVLSKTGKPSVLQVSEVDKPIPKPDEVLIKVKYSGINYADLLSRQGLYSWSAKRPYILGFEASGIVEAVGKNVTSHEVGDKVLSGSKNGCYAEYVSITEKQVFKLPEHFNFKEGAAFVANWATAWVGLHEMARVRRGERLLVQAAAGGVGTAAIQLGIVFDMDVYGTASTEIKRKLIEEFGATALTYDSFDKILADKPPDCVIESIGGDVYKRSFSALGPMGRLVGIGASGIQVNKRNPFSWYKAWKSIPRVKFSQVLRHSKAFMGLHIGYLLNQIDTILPIYQNLVDTMVKHNLKPVVPENQIFPMSKVADAHQFIHDRKNFGKVLLDPTR